MNRNLIQQALANRHPDGWVSTMSSAKLPRPESRPMDLPGKGREAAVMLLIFPSRDDGTLNTVLTRRRDDLQDHPGQISLPGGSRDSDETIEQTALREVEEEIGIDQSEIEMIGTLNSIYIPPSDFSVEPFVGWLTAEPTFLLQANEVAELIRVPIAYLLDTSTRRFSSVDTDPKPRNVPWFAIETHQVWGATAIILDDFAQRLQRQLSV